MFMETKELNKSDKILMAIEELAKEKTKVTIDDVAVRVWKKYPHEFCMRGYPQYPNVDINKYVTKLLTNNVSV